MTTPRTKEQEAEYIKLSLCLISKTVDTVLETAASEKYAVTSYGDHISMDDAVAVLDEITNNI